MWRYLIVGGIVGVVASANAQQTLSSSEAPIVRIAQTGTPAPGQSSSSADASTLAEKLQNPIADLISVPFQSNTNLKVGPHSGTQDILNIQPVIPIHINEDWNVITRTILPVVWSPSFQPFAAVPPFGLAPVTFSAFLSPTHTIDNWTWGAGPIIEIPTATNKTLGSNAWGLGPALVAVRTAHPWVYGLLVNTVFSMGGNSGSGGTRYTFTTINPFINYNLDEGWFVGTVPVITASWNTGGQKWTLPVGAQIGRLMKVADKLPVNLVVGAYYNALRPQFGATWSLRTQVTFIF